MAKPWGGKLPALAKDRAVSKGWRAGYEGELVMSREHTDMATFSFFFKDIHRYIVSIFRGLLFLLDYETYA